MNSWERLKKTLLGESMDCHAVMPYDGNFAIRTAGYDFMECYTDGKKLADAQTRVWELTEQDAVVAQSDQYYLSEGLGLRTRRVPGSLPTVEKLAVEELRDIDRLRPADPYHDGRMYVYIEAVGRLVERFGRDVPVRAPGTGAFTMAGHLMEPSRLITDIFLAEMEEDEETRRALHRLLEVTYETHFRFAEACVRAGAGIVQSGDSLASLNIISPEIYRKYAFPYEQRFFRRISRLKEEYDFVTLLHICGNNTAISKELGETGCDILECDYKVDLSDYAARLGNRVCLLGNLNPAGALLSGTADSVRAEAAQAMEHTAGYRFLLGSGCEVAAQAPLENVRAMVDIGHRTPALLA